MEEFDKTVFKFLLNHSANAMAKITGGEKYPKISGLTQFFALNDGVIVVTQVENLPKTESNIFAFHIHEGDSCEGDFEKTGGHFNPKNTPHPLHAGDMPPLFSNDGLAWQAFFTDRFKLNDILNRTVVIHEGTDDFSSQPAGNSGQKIACGKILPVAQKSSFFKRY